MYTHQISPGPHLAHHCHEGMGNRITWDGTGSRSCSTSPGRSALWLPVTEPRPPNNLCSLPAFSMHVTRVCPPPSSSGLTAALPSPHWYKHSCPTEAEGCRQRAGFVCDSSSYPCRGPGILHRLWLQRAVTVSCHWVQSLSPPHAAGTCWAGLAPAWDMGPRRMTPSH